MEITDLYELLPVFQCRPGCTACCREYGVPSRTPEEDRRIRRYLEQQGRRPGAAQGTTCPYVSVEGCTIYPVRPLICRLYGVSADYRCKKGVGPVRYLHLDQEAEILELYRSHFFPRRVGVH